MFLFREEESVGGRPTQETFLYREALQDGVLWRGGDAGAARRYFRTSSFMCGSTLCVDSMLPFYPDERVPLVRGPLGWYV